MIIEHKGLVNYQECRDEMIALVKSSPKIHHIWVVEHPPVFTIGISEKKYRRRPVKKSSNYKN